MIVHYNNGLFPDVKREAMPRISAEEMTRVRARLLEAAADVFAAKGLDAATMEEIAQAAGVATGTTYNYFGSKDELFGAVLEEGCRRTVKLADTLEDTGSSRDQLLALVTADVAILRESEGFYKVVSREAFSFRPETYAAILEHMAPLLMRIVQIIEHGIETDEIRRDRPAAQLAITFLGILALHFVQHWGSSGGWPLLDDVPELVVTTFFDGASAR